MSSHVLHTSMSIWEKTVVTFTVTTNSVNWMLASHIDAFMSWPALCFVVGAWNATSPYLELLDSSWWITIVWSELWSHDVWPGLGECVPFQPVIGQFNMRMWLLRSWEQLFSSFVSVPWYWLSPSVLFYFCSAVSGLVNASRHTSLMYFACMCTMVDSLGQCFSFWKMTG